MAIKNGSKGCTHDWVKDPKRWVEQCMAFKCRKCGAKGCGCDVERQKEDLKKLAELLEKYGPVDKIERG
jgi:hypothetical protein